MPDKPQQKQRTNRVFKSLHKRSPTWVSNARCSTSLCWRSGSLQSLQFHPRRYRRLHRRLAFGHWVTNSDPAFLRILAKSETYKLRYDAAKQQVPRVEVV